MIKPLSSQFPPDYRPRFRVSKRVSLLTLTFIFSLSSVGLMEDFQQNIWLKNYLLIAALLWGNLLIYLSFYPQWGQRLISLEKPNSDQK
jgi:phosphoglycerol transferase MdoB-like AlkP superfamily enzyme